VPALLSECCVPVTLVPGIDGFLRGEDAGMAGGAVPVAVRALRKLERDLWGTMGHSRVTLGDHVRTAWGPR
jgi:hypothetical protein